MRLAIAREAQLEKRDLVRRTISPWELALVSSDRRKGGITSSKILFVDLLPSPQLGLGHLRRSSAGVQLGGAAS